VYIEGDLAIGQADAARRQAHGMIRRSIKEIRYQQIQRYYHQFLSRVETFFLSTESEAQEVARRCPGVAVEKLPLGMDAHACEFLPPSMNNSTVGMIGNFGHPPNQAAFEWFYREIHPELKAKKSSYQFRVAGINPPAHWLMWERTDPQLKILGEVESLKSFYQDISFTVCPVVSGKGARTKVLESAAFGRDIVSTSLGAEGSEPLSVLLGDSPSAFCAQCLRLLEGNSDSATRVKQNRIWVESHFSNAAIVSRLLGTGDQSSRSSH
jgi:hypothetical protein